MSDAPIIIECEQGSQIWHDVRLAIPTGSGFDKLLTPAKLNYGLGRSATQGYLNELLADYIAGYPESEIEASDYMDRGTEMEPRARALYTVETGAAVEQVGFVMRADRRAGCSPDGLVGDDGGLEIKAPALKNHVGYMRDPPSLAKDYRGQVQGCLYITGRPWWDIMSFSTVLRPVIVRVEPEPDYHAALDAALGEFCDELDHWKREWADYRETRPDGFMSPLPGERSTLLDQLERSLEVVG